MPFYLLGMSISKTDSLLSLKTSPMSISSSGSRRWYAIGDANNYINLGSG